MAIIAKINAIRTSISFTVYSLVSGPTGMLPESPAAVPAQDSLNLVVNRVDVDFNICRSCKDLATYWADVACMDHASV